MRAPGGRNAKRVRPDDDRALERFGLDLVSSLAGTMRSVRRRPTVPEFRVEGRPGGIEFLVTTSAYGIQCFRDGRFEPVGEAPWAYGLGMLSGRWLAFERVGRRGRLVEIDPWTGRRPRRLVWGLPGRLHQMDTVDGRLVMTDPYNNRLLGWPALRRHPLGYWRRVTMGRFPWGPAPAGRRSANYAHFNSISVGAGKVYVVAHNDYVNSGRMSELWVLDLGLDVLERRPLGFANCHNYFTDGRDELWLASHAGQVVWNGQCVLDSGRYLRGLSVADDHIIVGGSDSFRRPQRATGTGRIIVFDRSFHQVAEIVLPGTQIHDIRRLDRRELAMCGT